MGIAINIANEERQEGEGACATVERPAGRLECASESVFLRVSLAVLALRLQLHDLMASIFASICLVGLHGARL